MQPLIDDLIPYPGIDNITGLCHLRIYERPNNTPVAIVGQLDDNPGTAITTRSRTIAALIRNQELDGHEFLLITYHTLRRRALPASRVRRRAHRPDLVPRPRHHRDPRHHPRPVGARHLHRRNTSSATAAPPYATKSPTKHTQPPPISPNDSNRARTGAYVS